MRRRQREESVAVPPHVIQSCDAVARDLHFRQIHAGLHAGPFARHIIFIDVRNIVEIRLCCGQIYPPQRSELVQQLRIIFKFVASIKGAVQAVVHQIDLDHLAIGIARDAVPVVPARVRHAGVDLVEDRSPLVDRIRSRRLSGQFSCKEKRTVKN